MPKKRVKISLVVARHGARADDDPTWATTPEACLWNPPLSAEGREQASSLGDYAVSLGIRRLAVSPFARCLQTAAAVARKILEVDERSAASAAEEKKEEEEEEKGAAAANNGVVSTSTPPPVSPPPPPPPLVIEIDCSLCEVLSRQCMGGEDPEGGQADPTLWSWGGNGGGGTGGGGDDDNDAANSASASAASPLSPLPHLLLLSAAASSGLPRDLTSVVPSSSFPLYPETAQEARSRYFRALSEAAARALVVSAGGGGGGGGSEEEEGEKTSDSKTSTTATATSSTVSVMAITHGEAVSAAATMVAGGKRPFAVPPTGAVVLEATLDDDDGDGDDDGNENDGNGDDGNGNVDDGEDDDPLASAASSLACARWELVEAARGVAFE